MKRAFVVPSALEEHKKANEIMSANFLKDFIEYVKNLNNPELNIGIPYIQKAFSANFEIGSFFDECHYMQMLHYYKECVIPHKIAVLDFGLKLADMPSISKRFLGETPTDTYERTEGMSGLRRGSLFGLLLIHDLSKFSLQEEAYAFYKFNGKTPKWFESIYNGFTPTTQNQFDYAWLHHLRNNPHHPGYWVLPTGAHDFYCLEMPVTYMLEMFCDWGGASVSYGGALEDWLPKNIQKYVFGRETASRLLELIKLYFADKPEVYKNLHIVDMTGYSYITVSQSEVIKRIEKLEAEIEAD